MGNSLEILQKIKYKTTIGVCMLSHVRCCNTMARNPMAFNPLGSSLHGILQARILQWVAISFSRGSQEGSNPCLLHWQADSLPLSHMERP